MSRGMNYLVINAVDYYYAEGQPGDFDYYATLNDANRAIPSGRPGHVILLSDVTLPAQLSQFLSGRQVTIDGQNKYTITRTNARIIQTGGANIYHFKDVGLAGEVYFTAISAGFQAYFTNVKWDGRLYFNGANNGQVFIHDSAIVGTATYANPVYIIQTTVSGEIVVSNTYLKGNSGSGAVFYQTTGTGNTVSFDDLYLEYCQVFHGSLGSNNPFEGNGIGGAPPTNDYAAHHCVFNIEPDVSDPTYLNNTIASAQRHNTIDVDGDYNWLV